MILIQLAIILAMVAAFVSVVVVVWKGNQPPTPPGEEPVLWPWLFLLLGLIPPPALLMAVGDNPKPWVLVVVIVCCLVSGFGFFCRSVFVVSRIFLGFCTAVGLLVFNVFVAFLIGCSGHGRIAP